MRNKRFCFSVISFVLALSAMLASVFSLTNAQLIISGSLGYTTSNTEMTAEEYYNLFKTEKPEMFEIFQEYNVGLIEIVDLITKLDNSNNDDWGDYGALTPYCIFGGDIVLDSSNSKIVSYSGEKTSEVYYPSDSFPQKNDSKWEITFVATVLTSNHTAIKLICYDYIKETFSIIDVTEIDYNTKSVQFYYEYDLPFVGILIAQIK